LIAQSQAMQRVLELMRAAARQSSTALLTVMLNPSLRFSGRLDSLKQLETATQAAEKAHAIVFLMMLLPTAYALTKGWLDAAGWMMLFNIPFNMYPVKLQRYNRMRLQRLVQKRRFHRPVSTNGGS
jgi:hypothetical protein